MNKSESQRIEGRVRNHIKQTFDTTNIPLVVGVSGGPDSVALLHILANLHVPVTAVHVNYEKRGREADLDQELVESLSEKWNVPCFVYQVGDEYNSKQNFQQWARKIRFKYLAEVKEKVDAEAVALAHHQDDQVETILQKLFRGAGPGSWAGMSVFDQGIFRPLLNTTRAEIETYLKVEDIPWRIDQSNLKSTFARNFLRNEWIPQLEEWFPGWRQNILKLPDSSDTFTKMTETLLNSVQIEPDILLRDELLTWDEPVRKSVILRWIKNFKPDATISGNALGELDKLDELQTGKFIQLTDELKILRDRKHFVLMEIQPPSNNLHRIFHREELLTAPIQTEDWQFTILPFDNPDFNDNLYLDADKIKWPLHLRKWRAGDRIQPFGMNGTQKVKDRLTNEKISSASKSSAAVMEDQNRNVVALLFPATNMEQQPGTIADFVKCEDETDEVLCITYSAYETL